MEVEIWSDIMCPFCYIGKRKFEEALAQFPHKEQVQVTWHSFQLQPDMQTMPGKSINDFLAESKGISREQAKQMNDHVTVLAKEVGLAFHLDKAVVANSLDGHRLSHLAAKHNLQDEAEERLFYAYFTEGRNVADHEVLVQLGVEIGLEEQEVRAMLASDTYTYEVKADHRDAQNLGARGVPFFVIDRKYGVSGAQPSEVFLQALTKAWEDQGETKQQ